MQELEAAFKEHNGTLLHIGIDSAFDPLRNHSRFIALLRRMSLPQPPKS